MSWSAFTWVAGVTESRSRYNTVSEKNKPETILLCDLQSSLGIKVDPAPAPEGAGGTAHCLDNTKG